MLQILKIKSLVMARFAALFVLPLAAPLLISFSASAQGIGGATCAGSSGSTLTFTDTGSTTNCVNSTTNINTIVTDVVNIFSVVVGIIAVIMIIVGGFRYITSGGSGDVSGAKNTIVFALIGLVIVALAQVLVHFVLYHANAAAVNG